jgi:hypothetical protein
MALKVKQNISPTRDTDEGRSGIPVLYKGDLEEQYRLPRVRERLARVRRQMQRSS